MHTLRKLVLSLRNATELPSPAKIRGHSNTLRTLLLDITDSQPTNNSQSPMYLTYGQAALQGLVRSCTFLKHLGIAFPTVGLEYATSPANATTAQHGL